jgi:hypothetical protein
MTIAKLLGIIDFRLYYLIWYKQYQKSTNNFSKKNNFQTNIQHGYKNKFSYSVKKFIIALNCPFCKDIPTVELVDKNTTQHNGSFIPIPLLLYSNLNILPYSQESF